LTPQLKEVARFSVELETVLAILPTSMPHASLSIVFSCVHTDGSKIKEQVSARVVSRTTTELTRLPNKAIIFRAELHAILLPMVLIYHHKEKNSVIFADSDKL